MLPTKPSGKEGENGKVTKAMGGVRPEFLERIFLDFFFILYRRKLLFKKTYLKIIYILFFPQYKIKERIIKSGPMSDKKFNGTVEGTGVVNAKNE